MAKKEVSAAKASAAIKKSQSGSSTLGSSTSGVSRFQKVQKSINELSSAVNTTYKDYVETLTPRLKLIDLFLVFLVLLGILQFIYVILVGNFPFNAFLGGFISCVGQFVLTVSLRLQIKVGSKPIEQVEESLKSNVEDEKVETDDSEDNDIDEELVIKTTNVEQEDTKIFKVISPERSFGDFIFASLILHFIVIHFIN
ncbi:DAD family-domain-containing protein [Scheffersomyces amazonensis]|uniref:DAD family-domain-containing protein n=1 Tax=Scheffersomyces amazonensis TaxID=1078765 RepID=UPI00315D7525